MIRIKALDQLREATEQGCRFLSFLYQSKGTGEVAKHTVNYGINYRNAIEDDKASLEAYIPQNALEEQAKAEMLLSMTQHLEKGVSDSYTLKGVYESIGNGLAQHTETGELYIKCYSHSKEQIEPPTKPKKPTKHGALKLAKMHIEKACSFKHTKFKTFILSQEHIGGMTINGDVVEIHR